MIVDLKSSKRRILMRFSIKTGKLTYLKSLFFKMGKLLHFLYLTLGKFCVKINPNLIITYSVAKDFWSKACLNTRRGCLRYVFNTFRVSDNTGLGV